MLALTIDDHKYYSIPQVAEILGINKATARYKIFNKIPKQKKYMINMNTGWKTRIIRVSWFAIKSFILWL